MRIWILSLLLLCGCAQLKPAPVPDAPLASLFNDAAFAPPAAAASAADLFTLSPAMREHLDSTPFKALLRDRGQVMGLLHALYDRNELQLDYDATHTGTAAETYAARKGNCLSLVVMTAAFARELGMAVRFQEVQVDTTWNREGGLYVVSSHVNLTLAPRSDSADAATAQTVDFVPSNGAARYRTRTLEEADIVALYSNNRAAEALVRGQLNDAYWWARAAVQARPTLAPAYNTLAVVYERSGNKALAEQVYRVALEREADSLVVMQNLARLLAETGKTQEAQALNLRLAKLYPAPPYHYFNEAMAAYNTGDFRGARSLLAREVARAPYNDEFHFWLGIVNLQLGEWKSAQQELALARDTSIRADTRARYSAKLAHLRGLTGMAQRQ